jgi:hypothetical protein
MTAHDYYYEIGSRNPSIFEKVENSFSVRIEDIVTFTHAETGFPLGSRVNYSYGRMFGFNTNHNFRTEDFPTLPAEWEIKQPEPTVQTKVGFREGHVCAVPVNTELSADEASRQRILNTQDNLADWPRSIRNFINLVNFFKA